MTVLLALSGALLIGGADFAAGMISRREHPARVTVWVQLGSMAIAVGALAVLPGDRVTRTDVMAGLVAGLSGGFSFLAFYAALARGQMGRIAPVTAVIGALVPSIVGLIRGESLGAWAIAGGVIGIISIALVTQERSDGQRPVSRMAFVLAAVAGLGFSLFFLALDATSPDAGAWPLVYARMASVPATIVAARVLSGAIRFDGSGAGRAMLTGVVEMVANILALLAFQRGPLVIATVMSSFYPLSTVLLARVVAHERLRRVQWIGMTLGILAVPMIAAG